jgi:hypothetical protein
LKDKDIIKINNFADKIARDRYESGFKLNEILTALNLFQSVFYNYCFNLLTKKGMLENINLLNMFFNVLKDEISCTYLKLSGNCVNNNLDVKPLFKGTEAHI